MLKALEVVQGHHHADDTIRLPYSERFKRRIRLKTEQGEEVLLDLQRATELKHRCFLKLEDGRLFQIKASVEQLLEVIATDLISLPRLAWHIGNRHLPCEILEDRLRIEADAVIEDMLMKLGAKVQKISAQFQPEGGAYGQGRIMGHQH